MFNFIFCLLIGLLLHANELPKIKVAEFKVSQGDILALPGEPGEFRRFDGDDYSYLIRVTKTAPNGQRVEYELTREFHSGAGTAHQPTSSAPKAPDAGPGAPSTTAKIANAAGVTILIYEVVDQTKRSTQEMSDAAKRLRQLLDHGVRAVRLSAAEQRAAAAEMNRETDKNFSRALTNAGIASSKLRTHSNYAHNELPDPRVSCRAGGVAEDFARTKTVGDAGRLARYVSAALENAESECRALVPEVTNGDFVLDTRKVESLVPESPLNDTAFLMPAGTVVGRQLRELANDYQTTWISKVGYRDEPGQLDLFNSGSSLLGAADDAYNRGEVREGQALQNASRITLDILRGARDGVIEAVDELYHTIPAVAVALKDVVAMGIHHPQELAQASQRIVAGIPAVAREMYSALVKDYHILKDGSAYERSRLFGKQITTQVIGALGGRLLNATGTGVSVVKASARATIVKRSAAKHLAHYSEHIRGQWMAPIIDESKVVSLAHRLREAEKVIQSSNAVVTNNAREFMASHLADAAVANVEVSAEALAARGHDYLRLEAKMMDVKLTNFEGEMSRGIPKKFTMMTSRHEAPIIFENTSKSVMKFTHHGYLANSRFGRFRTQLYGAVGFGPEVENLISLETGRATEDLVFATQKVSLNRVLDLTDAEVLGKLGLTVGEVTSSDYGLTHALGHIAGKQGIEGIVFESAKRETFKNIVIF